MFPDPSTRCRRACQCVLFVVVLVGYFSCQAFPSSSRCCGSRRTPPWIVLRATDNQQQQPASTTGRKPRFTQQVHKESLPKPPRQQQPQQEQKPQQQPQQQQERRELSTRPTTSIASSSNNGSTTERQVRKITKKEEMGNNNQQRTGKANYNDSSSSSSSMNNGNNNDRRPSSPYIPRNVPWNSGKSVEELESIMTKRWGTDSKRWSDDEDENDEDEEDYDDDVVDNNKNGHQAPEYYDADDVGYERKPTSTTKQANNNRGKVDLNFDNIMSPKPVGGRGTNFDNTIISSPKTVSGRGTNVNPKKDGALQEETKKDQGGFFFPTNSAASASFTAPASTSNSREQQQILLRQGKTNVSPTRQQSSNDSADIQQPNREKQVKAPLLPFVKDENGTPLLLTLEQAQKNFDGMVASKDKLLNNNDDDPETDDSSFETDSASWEELGITSPILLRNLQRMQCPKPLAVQAKACPAIITGQDVLVGTYTGSGKTLAFLVPLIERLLFSASSSNMKDENHDDDDASKDQITTTTQALQILVVVPGRELASQVVSVARQLLEGTGMQAMLAIGGTGFTRNLQDIRAKKPAIVVGTPGRIAELIVGKPGEKGGRLKLPNLQSLVLDEFDALLEYKPHRDPTAAIVTTLKQRHRDALQAILCSATATDMLGSPKLNNYLRPGFARAMADRNDVLVTSPAEGENDNAGKAITRVSRTVIHGVVHVEHRRLALETLRRILHTDPIPQQILIFVENARKVDIVVDKLDAMGILAAPLSGGPKSEKMDRAEVSKALREGFVGIVVATEMAARGLDAPLLTHVINLDLPTDASHYAHRAGRCGRGGRPGVVINLTTSPQERHVPQKFANHLGIAMYTVEARAGKLHIVEDIAE